MSRRFRMDDFSREIAVQAHQIHKSMSRITGWTEQDSYNEAVLAFCRARESWDPSLSKFITHYFNHARYRRLELIKREAKYYWRDLDREIEVEAKNRYRVPSTKCLLDHKEMFSALAFAPSELKGDIVEVLKVMLHSPTDFIDFVFDQGHIKPTLQLLGNYLKISRLKLDEVINWIREEVVIE